MNTLHTNRYTCQLLLPGFGEAAQQRLQRSKALIVGMGGLGCPVSQYLVAAGVGTLGIADHDVISLSNLHRQVLYAEDELGQDKVTVAAAKLKKQNPQVDIIAHTVQVNYSNVQDLVSAYDLVIDATDNFETHYLLNDACVIAGVPLVHGAIYQYEGHVAVWNMPNVDGTRGPNYRDVFPVVNAMQVPACSDGGVLPTIAGIIGCMQANEAIKVLAGLPGVLSGRMLVFDAQSMRSHVIKIADCTNTHITELQPAADVPSLDKEALQQLLNSADVLLVDVRSPEEHERFNIGGINIPLQELEDKASELSGGRRLVCYCASGKRSRQAAWWIKQNLPAVDVATLSAGIEHWR